MRARIKGRAKKDRRRGSREPYPALTQFDIDQIKLLHSQGMKPAEIAVEVRRSLSSVYKIIKVRGRKTNTEIIRSLPMAYTPRSE